MGESKYEVDFIYIILFMINILLLASEFYITHFNFLLDQGLVFDGLTNTLITLKENTFIFNSFVITRFLEVIVVYLILTAVSSSSEPGDDKGDVKYIAGLAISLFFFLVTPLLNLGPWFFLGLTVASYAGIISFLAYVKRHYKYFGSDDEFNEKNEIFKQVNKKQENEYSVNFKTDKGLINVVNPFRATMVLGTPGSGKSYSVIEEYIRQHLQKKFTMLVYDFKYPSLAKETYAFYNYYKKNYKVEPKFCVVSLDDLADSSFINPISPTFVRKAADAIECSQTILYNLNKEWIEKKDFFAQSAISYFAACIYFLKIYQNGKFCTLPHAISLSSCPDERVFKIFEQYQELKFFMTPFADALAKKAYEQLAGQTASARIPLSQLATKELFWVMGNNVYPHLNVPLDINNPENPTIMILANSPATQTTNSPALGLISTQILKEINRQNKQPCSVIIDELPTMYFMGLDNLIATARSNKISTTIGMQDLEQLKRDYGDKVANTIFNIVGNVFSGAVRSETATKLQDIFGKKKQKLKNLSVDNGSTSYTLNESLEFAIPASVISQLSQGEFVGVVSDNFGESIDRKIFRGSIKIDKRHDQIKKKIPNAMDIQNLDDIVEKNFKRIIAEIDILVDNELYKISEKQRKVKEERLKKTSAKPPETKGGSGDSNDNNDEGGGGGGKYMKT